MLIRRLPSSLLALAGTAALLAGCGSSAPAKHITTHRAAAVTKPAKKHKQTMKHHVKHRAKHKAVHRKMTASTPVTTAAAPPATTTSATQAAPPPTTTTTPPPPPTTTTTPPPPPPTTTTKTQPAGGGGGCIPQGKNAGDGDSDNRGAPSDGDGCL